MGSLFKKPKATSTSSTTVNVPSWLDSYNKDLLSKANTLSQNPFVAYSGNRVADFNSDNMAAFDAIRKNAGMYDFASQISEGANTLYNRSMTGPSSSDIESRMNPYLENVLNMAKTNAIEDFGTSEAENRRRDAMIGSFGGSRVAVGQSMRQRDFGKLLSDMETTGRSNAYESALGQYNTDNQSLYNMLSSMYGMNTKSIQDLLSIGELQRGQAQQEADFQASEFDREQAYPYEQTNWLASLLQPYTNAYAGNTTVGTQKGGGSSPFSQIAGTALSAAAIMSDRRTKENIKKVGELDNSLPVYLFNYKGDNTPTIGVMAQDVEKVNPDAVSSMDGIKMVDYSEATRKAMGGEIYSREGSAKKYNPFAFQRVQATPLTFNSGNDGMNLESGLAAFLSAPKKEKDNDYGPRKVDNPSSDVGIDAYNNLLGSSANPFTGVKASDPSWMGSLFSSLGFADGGEITPSRFWSEPDDNIFTTTAKGIGNLINDTGYFVRDHLPKVEFTSDPSKGLISQTSKYLGDTPSKQVMKDLYSINPLPGAAKAIGNWLTPDPRVGSEPDDAAMTAKIQSMKGAQPQSVEQPMPVNPPMPPQLPQQEYEQDLGALSLPDMPTPVKEEEVETSKQTLFGREVNLPLLMMGLTMMSDEGDFFSSALPNSLKSALSTQQALDQQVKDSKKEARATSIENTKLQLDVMKGLAYIEQVRKQGNLSPYQARLLDLKERELIIKAKKEGVKLSDEAENNPPSLEDMALFNDMYMKSLDAP